MLGRAPIVIWKSDLRGTIDLVEGSVPAALTSALKELLGRTITDAPKELAELARLHEKALAGQPAKAVIPFASSTLEVSCSPTRDADGALSGAVGVATDITERVDTRTELRHSEELNRSIMESMPGGMVFVSAAGQILQANPEAQRILGLRLDQLTQRFVSDFEPETIHEDGTPFSATDYPVTQCLMTQKAQPPSTLGVKLRSGEISWAVFTAVPVKDPMTAEFVGAVVTFLDITARKKAEETRRELERQLFRSQKLEAVGRLAGGIAHDFNNVLVAILGHASMLRTSTAEGSAEHEAALTIELAAERAARLTKQLIGFARRGKHQEIPVDVDGTIAETIRLLKHTLNKNIQVVHEKSAQPVHTSGDPAQLQQVFLNLALNARDAMPTGGTLRFRTRRAESTRNEEGVPRPVVAVTVTDDGVGISDEARQWVFEPFFTTKETGNGMGLAMAYGIVRNHGGSIQVESQPGKGTTFLIEFPWIEVAIESPPEVTSRISNSASAKILVIDDEALVRKVVKTLLERLGYQVMVAAGGEEAIQLYENGATDVDLVLLDLVMPGMDGTETFKRLRAINPRVHALLTTGYGRDGAAQAALDEGVQGLVQKPYTISSLSEAIESALGRARPTEHD